MNDVYSFTSSTLFSTLVLPPNTIFLTTSGVGSTPFATVTNTNGVLNIAFNSNATTALVQDVVRHIGYTNTTPYGNATLRMELNDGTSSSQADVLVTSSTIHVDQTTLDSDGDAADGFNLKEALAIAQDGDTILIHDGTYRGQFVATKAVTIDALNGASGHVTLESPDTADLVPSTQEFLTHNGRWRMPILDLKTDIAGSGTVTVKNITVDGRYQALVDGYPANKDLIGIGVFNTNALIDGVTVKNVADNSSGAYANTDENFGIVVEGGSTLATPAQVTIQNSTLETFQRTGIIAWGSQLHVNILDNTLVGTGVSSLTVQNAIQIGSSNTDRQGTTALVQGNTITGLDTANTDGYQSSSIALYQSGAVEIANNYFGAGTREETDNITAGVTVMAPLQAVNIHDNTFANLAYGVSFEYYDPTTLGLAHQLTNNNFSDTELALSLYLDPPTVTTTNTVTVNQASTTPTNASGKLSFILQDNNDRFTDTGSAPSQVTGNAGHDTISTGSGADTLIGGTGDDRLTGGAGGDIFQYDSSNNGIDTITDFGTGDAIRVTGRASLGGTVTAGTGTLVATNSIQTNTSGGTTTLYIDTDATADTPELQINLTGTYLPGNFVLDGEYIRYQAISTPTPTPTPTDPTAPSTPEPTDPVTTLPPIAEWPSLPDGDGDGIPAQVESLVPSLNGNGLGDGNGDGIADTEQANVTSTPFRNTEQISQDPNAPVVFVTLVGGSNAGTPSTGSSVQITSMSQLDAPTDKPDSLTMPLGLISFTATASQPGASERFSLFIDGEIPIDGYWKQDHTGAWVNLASEAYGGSIVTVDGKTRVDFTLADGGEFDHDGVADGIISDPGALGLFTPTETDTDHDQFPDALEANNGLTVGVKDNDVFSSNRLFVMQVYRDILGREAEADGLTFWQQQLDSGALSRTELVTASLNAPEFQNGTGAILRLYQGVLGHLPDNATLSSELNLWHTGTTLATLADNMIGSAEFMHKYGSTTAHEGLLTQLYLNALGRTPDTEGLNYWLNQMEHGTSLSQVLIACTESAEFKAKTDTDITVALAYSGLLDRTPDQSGYDFWRTVINQGVDEHSVIDEFLASAEYHDRFLPSVQITTTGTTLPEVA